MTTAAIDERTSLEELEKLVVSSSKEYSCSYAALMEMKAAFDLTKTHLSSPEFQRLRSALDQQGMITEEKLQAKNSAEIAFADRYRKEVAEKASGDRAQRESALLEELQNIDLRLAELNATYRNIPNLISAAADRKNAILRELVRLKETS